MSKYRCYYSTRPRRQERQCTKCSRISTRNGSPILRECAPPLSLSLSLTRSLARPLWLALPSPHAGQPCVHDCGGSIRGAWSQHSVCCAGRNDVDRLLRSAHEPPPARPPCGATGTLTTGAVATPRTASAAAAARARRRRPPSARTRGWSGGWRWPRSTPPTPTRRARRGRWCGSTSATHRCSRSRPSSATCGSRRDRSRSRRRDGARHHPPLPTTTSAARRARGALASPMTLARRDRATARRADGGRG